MRLTLRTLLAYLDDTLDPRETKEIGQKVAESEQARELVARIRQVTRRRRLTTPEGSAAEDAFDAAKVAEYLDSTLSADEIAELEKLCLESDVHLAEVAACHQILTLVLGEPVHVPPTAYERMYTLVRGREAIHGRKAPPSARNLSLEDSTAELLDGDNEVSILGIPYRQRQTEARQLLPVAGAAVLVLGLGALLVFALAGRDPGRRRELPPGVLVSAPTASPVSPATRPRDKQEPPPGANPAIWSGLVSEPPLASGRGRGLSGASMWTLWSTWGAARPAVPNFVLIADSRTDLPIPEPGIPDKPEPALMPTPAIPAPNQAQAVVAKNTTTKEALGVRRLAQNDYRLLRPQAAVQSSELLVALPGYTIELTTDKGVRLELNGSLPEPGKSFTLETAVVLHVAADFDLDFTLDRGRVTLRNKPVGQGTVRMRFYDQVWDLKLLEPSSKVGVELTGLIPRGTPSWEPRYMLVLFTADGAIELRRGAEPERIEPKKVVIWDSAAPTRSVLPVQELPPWFKGDPLPELVRNALASFYKRVVDKVGKEEQELPWIKVAVQETLGGNRMWERPLAPFTLGALDQLEPLVRYLDENDAPDIRIATLDTLWHWLGRNQGQREKFQRALADAGYTKEESDLFNQLQKGMAAPSRATYEFLLAQLNHKRLAIRQMAFMNILELAANLKPPIPYEPGMPPDQREKGIEALRARLLKSDAK